MVLILAWSILDVSEYITAISELEVLGVIVWLIIGVPVSLLVGFITAVLISPTVIRTDAVMSPSSLVNYTVSESEERTTQKETTPKMQKTNTHLVGF